MRRLFPSMLLAAALASFAAQALAKKAPHHDNHRSRAHVSLHVSRHAVLSGHRVVLRGRVRPRGSHRVKLVVRGPGGRVTAARSRRDGSFALRWRPRRVGSYRIRAYGRHDRRVRAGVSAARRVTAFRPAGASYYGPGLYGGALACGGTLQPGTLGVANKTLPCGSKVTLRYRSRTITVPVIDRGPYVAGRDYDLTAATRARLHFPSTGVVLASR
jgi:peptidoglycan lytic transglycosylase